jgi:BirA family biotin operon repressor/biotin-[acetyl-CoA-carboxylase] ligase
MPLTEDRAVDSYDLAALDCALAGTPFAGNLHHFPEIDSTNTYAMQQGAAGAPHGSVYLADAQTAGRGRGAHTWSSPPGSGLYVSILLRPALAPGDALWCSLAAGLAVGTAIHQTTGLVPDLRWPNDILIGKRKLAGILTEMHAEATRVRYLVIGIGINVHQPHFPAELASVATSLALEGRQTTRGTLLTALLRSLDEEATALTASQPEQAQQALVARLNAASSWIRGKSVIVDEGQPGAHSTFAGVTAGLDARGFLLVQNEFGLRTVLSGGVREA